MIPSPPTADTRLLKLRSAGLFSNVNEVVEQLRLAELGGYQFGIDWSESCYRDELQTGDPWEYYFEPCFSNLTLQNLHHSDAPILPGGVKVACTQDNIITPRIHDGDCNPLLLPRDRIEANRLIKRYIHLSGAASVTVDKFKRTNFSGELIGLHIRGLGRTHGGVPELRKQHSVDGHIPFGIFFEKVEQALKQKPSAKIFACSDSSEVIETVKSEFGSRVLTYEATRSKFGEMHANHPENNGQKFSPHKLGMDVLLEAYLLAQTDFLIHGNSNVCNFVLCLNPNLPHEYVKA